MMDMDLTMLNVSVGFYLEGLSLHSHVCLESYEVPVKFMTIYKFIAVMVGI